MLVVITTQTGAQGAFDEAKIEYIERSDAGVKVYGLAAGPKTVPNITVGEFVDQVQAQLAEAKNMETEFKRSLRPEPKPEKPEKAAAE
jgi:hypothetical protein